MAVLVGSGCLVGAPAAGAAPGDVSIDDSGFLPRTVTIAAGDAVVWTNDDDTEHRVDESEDSDEYFDSGDLDPGESYSHTFATPGRYPYECEIHSEMTGTVVVE
ncbi:MAG: cupredoxin domain-containing protein, partial [Acidimicrobiia bacterium]